MQMIGTALSSDARFSPSVVDGTQSVSGRPNRPPGGGGAAADYFDTGRPPFSVRPYPPPPPPYLENGPQPQYLGSYGLRPGPIQYPQQNSILQVLGSISQHDDLRCVPRLLCEVSSGTRPSSSGYYQPGVYYQQQQQQQSTIPFLSKDALIT